MRRSLAFASFIALFAACVTVEPPPDPRGAVKPGQRMIVLVHQSPGPWIVADPDSKAETAIKLLPLGNFLQGIQEERINTMSKELQQYLPRPRYDQAVEAALIKALKAAHGGEVQTAAEAGIAAAQRRDWNTAADQLDWRRKYYFTDAGKASPRDYTKLLSLDDAVILDVNVSFGLEPNEDDRTLPVLSAASRLYRADTARMLWSRETRLADATSSSTLTEFRAAPAELTDRLYSLTAPLASRVAADFGRDTGLYAGLTSVSPSSAPASGVFYNGAPSIISTGAAPSAPPEPAAPPKPYTDWPPIKPADQQPTSSPSR